jgi:hypothetical protein
MKNKLKAKGMWFSEGLTESEILKIEEIYEIMFPKSLREFYQAGVPCSDTRYEFPRWTDYSVENISKIKSYWLKGPIDRLLPHVTMYDYWIHEWGKRPESPEDVVREFTKIAQKAPKLIPIHYNAYMTMLIGVDDPPVISAVEFDVVYGLHNLQDYLESYFLEDDYNLARKERLAKKDRTYIPFWSDIFNYNMRMAAKNFNKGIREGIVKGQDFKTADDFM